MRFSLIEALQEEESQYLVGITYEIWTRGDYNQDAPHEKGWELEKTPSTMNDLVMIAGNYGIQPNDLELQHYWANDDAPQDWMNDDEMYYQMWVKHMDGSDLSTDERTEINDVLNG